MSTSSVEKIELSNGITVLADSDSRFRAAAYSVCLYGGLRGETDTTVGLTHLCEHLLFKRTSTKTPRQIAERIDELGAEINAFTDSDSLCLHGVVPSERLEELMDFFGELFCDAAFTENDLDLEKEVIRQEILDSEDDPGDVVCRRFSECFWPDSVLGLPVYGTIEHLETFSYGDVYERLHSLLLGKKIVIAAAGNCNAKEIAAHAKKTFGSLTPGRRQCPEAPTTAAGISTISKPFTQIHFLLGTPWPSIRDEDYFCGLLISSALGDGMSSRLFQSLREEHGLVYDICADVDAFPDTAVLTISGVVEKGNLPLALELILAELAEVRKGRFREDELQRAIALHQAQLSMEADSVTSRMWRVMESELVYKRYMSREEISEKLGKISLSDVDRFLGKWFDKSSFLMVLGGDVEDLDISESVRDLCGNIDLEIG